MNFRLPLPPAFANAPFQALRAAVRQLGWAAWAWGLGLGAMSLLALAAACWTSWSELRRAEAALAARQAHPLVQKARAAAPKASDAAAPVDLLAPLPTHPDTERALQRLQQACQQAGVSLTGLRWTPPAPADPTQLQRAELAVQLRGPYPALRQALGETLARVPGLTLRQLALRRSPQAAEVEAELLFSLWARPLAQPAGEAG